MPKPKFNGTKLRQLRRTKVHTKRGITIKVLAKEIGASENAVSRWERGETSPPSVMVMAISKFLEVPMEELFFDPETEPETLKLKKKTKKETKKSNEEGTRS